MVTSAAGDGKTTVAANLGRALQQAGHTVLLVAADVRRPTLHTAFGAQNAIGFADLLADVASTGYTSTTRLHPGLTLTLGKTADGARSSISMIARGRLPEDPGRLFTQRNAQALFAVLRRHACDYIVVDTPPTQHFVDAQVLAQGADALVVVARLHHAQLHSLRSMQDMLARIRVRYAQPSSSASTSAGIVVVGSRPARARSRRAVPDSEAVVARPRLLHPPPNQQPTPSTGLRGR